MRDEIDELLNDLDLNDISDLDDIELSEAEKMLNEAYEMVNGEFNDSEEAVLEDDSKTKKKRIKSKLEVEEVSEDTNEERITGEVNKIKEEVEEIKAEEIDKLEKINKDTSKEISQEERDALKKELEETLKAKKELEKQLEEAKKNAENKTEEKSKSKRNVKGEEEDSYEEDQGLDTDSSLDEDENKNINKKELKEKASETFKNLFYNIQDEEYEKEQRKLDRKEKRKKEAKKKEAEKAKADKAVKTEEKKKKAAEEKAAKAKAAADAKKKKADAKKKQAEKKKKEKAEREKAMENEPVGRINKLGAVVVFLFIALITSGVILLSIQVGKLENYEEQAREYMAKGHYEQAYMTLLKEEEEKIKDTELYEQLRLIQKLNKKISYYSSNKALLDREKALDALVSGVEMYDSNKTYAKKIGIREQYDSVFVTIKDNLKSEYNMSLDDARELAKIKSKETYSEEISRICKETKIKNRDKKSNKKK